MLICVLYGVQCVAQSIYRYTSVISLTCIIYLSPCFRLRNIAGNSCLQADPKSAVSSRALYLVELRNMLPARKLLQSCETMKSHMKQPTCTCIYYNYIYTVYTWKVSFVFPSSATNSSTAFWSQKKRCPCKAGLWLTPADFLRGRPKTASNA